MEKRNDSAENNRQRHDHAVNEKLNTYEGIAEYYDTLMTNGYYDYGVIASALDKQIAGKRVVLELGVGTGLLAEQLLSINSEYKITGVDNTEAMLKQAKERLGDKVDYVMQDITALNLDKTYEAAFSVGGCWYFIDSGDNLEFCSHIDDPNMSKRGLKKVVEHLEPKGLLAFSLQGIHSNYTQELSDELVYSQSITKEDGGFLKLYEFKKGDDVVASQHYRYATMQKEKTDTLFQSLGCEPVGLDEGRKFYVYRKN